MLSRRDWAYLLGLLVPFVVYDLALKGFLLSSWPGYLGGIAGVLVLMQSDLLFNLGYASLWVGLFAMARKGFYRYLVVVLFHGATVFVALVTTIAYQYFQVTGSPLDLSFVLFSLSSSEGLGDVVASEVSPGLLILILSVLAYVVLGPWLVARAVGWPSARARTARTSWLRPVGVGITACTLLWFSMTPGRGPNGVGKSVSRDAFVNVAVTAFEANSEEITGVADPAAETPPPDASLALSPWTEKRNVVLVHLESVRAQSVTPYNQDIETTPFLDELAKESVLAERAYVVVPHTTNALAAVNCGVDPPLNPWQTKTLGDEAPSKCLGDLLKEQGYNTVWFTSSTAGFEIERLPELVKNFGYDEFYPLESMDTEGFKKANYFGYEDDIMLKLSEEWLKKQKGSGKPFLAMYETITPHHQYLAPSRYGLEDFSDDDELNRYQNSVRYDDFFLRNLFDQYKKLGLYENTVFVIYGDHGEGFGEHGRFQHDNTIYDEGLKIPLVFHDPKWCEDGCESGVRFEEPASQLDVLPTVADMLGYEIEGGAYEGYSLLRPAPKDRTLTFGCWNEGGCLASLEGTEKYVYHFNDKPEEDFDLSRDPSEQEDLADKRDPKELEKRRTELLQWRAKVNSRYGGARDG